MEKRIELERRARKANQITELNLDNCRSTNIVGLTDEYTALESLSLINVGLTTLKGFPKLPNLKKLELSDNRISNGLHYLTTSPKLQTLNLSGNRIKDLETLKPLQEFKNLSILDLFNNEATLINDYRKKIFEMLPSLKYLDGFDCNDVEVPSEGDDDEEANGNDSEDEDDNDDGEDYDECEEEYDSEDVGEDNEYDEDADGDDDGDGDADDNDVSLAEVYNDDLEEDNSDWAADGSGDDDDDDAEDDEEGEGDGEANDSTAADKDAEAEAEPEARGKKRKHEG